MNYNKNHDKKQGLGTTFPILSNQSTFSIEMINPNTFPSHSCILLPEIQAFFESEEGQREYAEWKAKKQA